MNETRLTGRPIPQEQDQSLFGAPSPIPLRLGAQIAMCAATSLRSIWNEDPVGAANGMTFIDQLAERAAMVAAEDLREVIHGAIVAIRATQSLAGDNVPAVFLGHQSVDHQGVSFEDINSAARSHPADAAYLIGTLIASHAALGLQGAWARNHQVAHVALEQVERLAIECDRLPVEAARKVLDGLLDGIRVTHRVAARNLPLPDLDPCDLATAGPHDAQAHR